MLFERIDSPRSCVGGVDVDARAGVEPCDDCGAFVARSSELAELDLVPTRILDAERWSSDVVDMELVPSASADWHVTSAQSTSKRKHCVVWRVTVAALRCQCSSHDAGISGC